MVGSHSPVLIPVGDPNSVCFTSSIVKIGAFHTLVLIVGLFLAGSLFSRLVFFIISPTCFSYFYAI